MSWRRIDGTSRWTPAAGGLAATGLAVFLSLAMAACGPPPSGDGAADERSAADARTGDAGGPVSPQIPDLPEDAPGVVVETSLGDIEIGLFRDRSPATVENFLQYVEAEFYAGTTFHRVIPGFMIQGGGLTPDMENKPTRDSIPNEATDSGLRNLRGTVAMARRSAPNSATSQFFINLADNAQLDPGGVSPAGYAVFGVVVDGMEVVDRIASVATGRRGGRPDVPLDDVMIEAVRRVSSPGAS